MKCNVIRKISWQVHEITNAMKSQKNAIGRGDRDRDRHPEGSIG